MQELKSSFEGTTNAKLSGAGRAKAKPMRPLQLFVWRSFDLSSALDEFETSIPTIDPYQKTSSIKKEYSHSGQSITIDNGLTGCCSSGL